jgi:hypothetical protein
MSNQYINLAQITRITLVRKKRIEPYYIEPHTWVVNGGLLNRLLGKTKVTVKGYRYDPIFGEAIYYSGTELEEFLQRNNGYIDEVDNNLYYYPNTIIFFSDGKEKEIYFKSELEMDAWVNETIKIIPTITLIKKIK